MRNAAPLQVQPDVVAGILAGRIQRVRFSHGFYGRGTARVHEVHPWSEFPVTLEFHTEDQDKRLVKFSFDEFDDLVGIKH